MKMVVARRSSYFLSSQDDMRLSLSVDRFSFPSGHSSRVATVTPLLLLTVEVCLCLCLFGCKELKRAKHEGDFSSFPPTSSSSQWSRSLLLNPDEYIEFAFRRFTSLGHRRSTVSGAHGYVLVAKSLHNYLPRLQCWTCLLDFIYLWSILVQWGALYMELFSYMQYSF